MRKYFRLLMFIGLLFSIPENAIAESRGVKTGVWLYESDGIPFVSVVDEKAVRGWFSTRARVLLGPLKPGDVIYADITLRSSWTDPDVYGRSCYDLRLALLDMQGNVIGEVTGSHRMAICEELVDKVVLTGARVITRPGAYQVVLQVGDTGGGIDLYGSSALRTSIIPAPAK